MNSTTTLADNVPNKQLQLADACELVSNHLLAKRNSKGHWEGRLADSALATATAISALAKYRECSLQTRIPAERIETMLKAGCCWLLKQQNQDGGWGDTDQSHSNVATTMLVVAALELAGRTGEFQSVVDRANQYIDRLGRVDALRKRYGKDKTFAVPILANCAIAGLVDWNEVSPLPFEAVVVPQKFYRFVNLPVVSYAVPALVAIGQARFLKKPPLNPFTRLIRKLSVKRGLSILEKMQPASGGFLEAIPLTCFVGMSLADSGRADHEVTHNCIRFVDESFREFKDGTGAWPIDTNLATWNTTLAVNALEDKTDQHLTPELLNWILECQYNERHPFTGADPGGWGWSDLSGAVPDADDTPGALLALRHWYVSGNSAQSDPERVLRSARSGIQWLLNLQNRDHGWPTFCRGWGRLPFDRSGNDLTAHVIRALVAWQKEPELQDLHPQIAIAVDRGFGYLRKKQEPDGSWLPLWFGNQDHPAEENPIYGTVKVLLAYLESGMLSRSELHRGVLWLQETQNSDGGWGGGSSHENAGAAAQQSSVQETALVTDLFARLIRQAEFRENEPLCNAFGRGLEWMLGETSADRLGEKWPIGFYFAKLWYYEELYPAIFATSALVQSQKTVELLPSLADRFDK